VSPRGPFCAAATADATSFLAVSSQTGSETIREQMSSMKP
jgi:hypothetical protein